MSNKLETRTMTGGSTGETDIINAQGEVLAADVEGLKNCTVAVSQDADEGTGTFLVQGSLDGTNWFTIASKAASDMAAGDNGAVMVGCSDANGMPLALKAVRVNCTALTSTSDYRAKVAGYRA